MGNLTSYLGKILAAAPAAIHIDTNSKPYLAGILDEIDKAIRAKP